MHIKKAVTPRKRQSEGRAMTRADLPAAGMQRWVANRKAAVVHAIDEGLISVQEAMATYELSEEELEGWIRAVSVHGLAALRTTRIQTYRQPRMLARATGVPAAENDAARGWTRRAAKSPSSGIPEG